ncbi:MAG: hypothetical protein WBF33_15405 [Candidatus Nitrosopolaris sp.]
MMIANLVHSAGILCDDCSGGVVLVQSFYRCALEFLSTENIKFHTIDTRIEFI